MFTEYILKLCKHKSFYGHSETLTRALLQPAQSVMGHQKLRQNANSIMRDLDKRDTEWTDSIACTRMYTRTYVCVHMLLGCSLKLIYEDSSFASSMCLKLKSVRRLSNDKKLSDLRNQRTRCSPSSLSSCGTWREIHLNSLVHYSNTYWKIKK